MKSIGEKSCCYPVSWIAQKEAAAWRTKLDNKEISAEPSAYQLAALYTLILHRRAKNSTMGGKWLAVMYFRFVNCPMLSEFTEKLALEATYVPTLLEPPNSLKQVHAKRSVLGWAAPQLCDRGRRAKCAKSKELNP